MTKKEFCINTSYTDGFKITIEADGTFVAAKGENRLKAESTKELFEMIKNFNKER